MIGAIGYGTICLLRSFEKNKWLFRDKNITGIPIVEECKEDYFVNLKFILEENIRELGGQFVFRNNDNQNFLI